MGAHDYYRSPEEYNRFYLTTKADIFPLGYVLYNIFFGFSAMKEHFKEVRGDKLVNVRAKQAIATGTAHGFPSKRTRADPLEEQYSQVIKDVIKECWVYEPNERISAADLVDKLQGIFQDVKEAVG